MKREVGGTGSAKTGEDEEQETWKDKKFFGAQSPDQRQIRSGPSVLLPSQVPNFQ